MKNSALFSYTLHLADNALILAQRNAEWCGHGPVLEQDIAITNISLDLIGQARSFYQYAALLEGNEATEDSLAYLRPEREYLNCLLVEQPNGDWAQTILKQYFVSVYQFYLYKKLVSFRDEQIAAIASKALPEVTYHLRWSGEWVIRLGDGTGESKKRISKALDELWRYTGELFMPASYETELAVSLSEVQDEWRSHVKGVFEEAGLDFPAQTFMQSGGKTGRHSEHLGYILTELQYMQRAYPNSEW
jgi:ring-1,2-phenylacetyl-CoA epoxidase subunit PaaC